MSVFLKNLDLSKIKTHKRPAAYNAGNSRHQIVPFPLKLYEMLEDVERQGKEHIVSWHADGKSFFVHDPVKFVDEILPAHFKQSKYKSFQRQLNFYNFQRVASGPFEGSYGHPLFIRGYKELCKDIKRQNSSVEDQRQKLSSSESSSDRVDVEMTGASDDEESTSESVAGKEVMDENILPVEITQPNLSQEKEFELSESITDNDLLELIEPPSHRDSFQVFLDSTFESTRRESFREGTRLSFVGKKFFFLPVEFTDIYGV